ncbi:ABC transporter substrate-binding protein [Microvirga massiliensis]|uniref:ABC transporter substrate-binding protein n=1 Tax=Microvirga massiliensis TaxID=1033741 RepID=UPI00065FC420|nr:ABC transporter substrate-binding protein [Microvirga massiliensis]
MNSAAWYIRLALAALVLMLSAAAILADDRVPRVGLLREGQLPDPFGAAFLDEMEVLGYKAGATVIYETRWAEGNPDRLPALARELAALKVDVILTGGDSAVRAAMEAAPTIPIVMGASNDPLGSGLAKSLTQPGGNVTGLTNFSLEMGQKRLETFRDAVPNLARVAVLYNPGFPSAQADLGATDSAARALGLSLRAIPVSQGAELESAVTRLSRRDIDGLITLADPFFTAHRERLAKLALAARLPTMFHWREFVEVGGLMSYGPDNVALYRRAAHFVDKILKGAKPETLPIEQPASFVLEFNLRTAKELGIVIPPELLAQADKVIE